MERSHSQPSRQQQQNTSNQSPERQDSYNPFGVQPLNADAIMQLQRTIGNQATIQFLQRQSSTTDDGSSSKSIMLLNKAAELNKKTASIKKFKDNVEALTKTVHNEGKGLIFKDKDLLASAKQLSQLAKQTDDIVTAYNDMAEQIKVLSKVPQAEKVSQTIEKIDKLLDSAEKIQKFTQQDKAMKAFMQNPHDYQKAKEWAKSTASVFKDASDLIPDSIPGIPNFVPKYFKGLLNAPANYVEVFIAVMDARINKIDAVTGGENDTTKVKSGGKTIWHGPLSRIYAAGYHNGLAQFMEQINPYQGIDLEEAEYGVGLALLKMAVRNAKPGKGVSRKKINVWLKLLKKY